MIASHAMIHGMEYASLVSCALTFPPTDIIAAVLVRLVRMTFRPGALDAFLDIFDASAPRIRAFPGCQHLELWQDPRYEGVLTTYSHWTDAEALDAYRHSDLFRSTWKRTRRLFAAPPEAHSHHVLRSATEIAEG